MKEKLDSAINVVKKTCDWIFKYRYWIALIIFILCIVFELSGSSIGAWGTFIQTDQTDDGVIFGKSREIRSDEWAVLTPMTFSQSFDGFNYFSNIINFLSDNKDAWVIENGQVLFYNQAKLNEYNTIVMQMPKLY